MRVGRRLGAGDGSDPPSVSRKACTGSEDVGAANVRTWLRLSLPPCCRFHPVEVTPPHRSDFGAPCCLHPSVAGSALGSFHFRGHICVHCRYGPMARNLPKGDLVDSLQSLGFPPPCYPNYGASDSYPGRTERASPDYGSGWNDRTRRPHGTQMEPTIPTGAGTCNFTWRLPATKLLFYNWKSVWKLERAMRFELTTPTLVSENARCFKRLRDSN